MPAYFDTGFSVRQPMWHGQGLILDDYPTDWNDARAKAGLLWEPRAVPAFRFVAATDYALSGPDGWSEWSSQFDADAVTFTPTGVFVPLVDHKLIERDDTGHVFGPVGDAFELVMHSEMGEIIDAILGQANVKFETAGSVRLGAAVWALVYLDEPYTTAGDDSETYPFLAVLNAHDGSGACKAVATQVRVVCWNTWNQASAEGDRTGRQFTFRHTAGVHDRIEEAKAALAGIRDDVKEWDALSTELFGMKADDVAFNHYLADFIPEPPAEIVSTRVRNNVDTARKMFRELYFDSVTNDSHRGTALGLVDASIEYLDHVRGYRSQDTLMGRTLLRPEPLKVKAVKLAREVCGV